MKTLLVFLIVSPLTLCAQSSVEKAKALYDSKKYPEAIKLLDAVDDEDKD